jgi:hypothetical protein
MGLHHRTHTSGTAIQISPEEQGREGRQGHDHGERPVQDSPVDGKAVRSCAGNRRNEGPSQVMGAPSGHAALRWLGSRGPTIGPLPESNGRERTGTKIAIWIILKFVTDKVINKNRTGFCGFCLTKL